MRRALIALAIVGGCGRISFDPRAGDGGAGDGPRIDAPPVLLDAGGCPPGYAFGDISCYRVVANPPVAPTWLEAEASCEADGVGAHLLVLDRTAEVVIVDSLVPGSIMDYWIGLTDLVSEADFRTVTLVPLAYTTWAAGQPDGGTISNCVTLYRDLTLHDSNCGSTNDYVCEYDGIAAVPAAYGQ